MAMRILLATLALLSLVLNGWQWWAARRFPLHRRGKTSRALPGVTLLKPLKGRDGETARCLASWLTQDYAGPLQILFGVASLTDPVCEVVRGLLAAHPERDARLVNCDQALGINAKVSTLIQLEPQVQHPVLIVSDADVRVPADLVANVLAPFDDASVGLVHCFYRLANPRTSAMRWEAVAINADFWSQVLQGQTLWPLDYAMGAVMATTRRHMDGIGGFAAIKDYLADDYQLGHLIAQRGAKIVLSPVVVECCSTPMGWTQVWEHQLRWARTIRACKPWPYAFSLLSNATLWPLLWLAAWPVPAVALTVILMAILRLATALDLQRRLTCSAAPIRFGWLVWIKDLAQAGLWTMSFMGKEVEWRGERYRIQPGGTLRKKADQPSSDHPLR